MMISSSNQRPSKSGLRGVERRAMDLHCLPFQQNPICSGTPLEGHELAFAYFGGVFRKLRYDNLTSAVTKILRGHRREETARFIAFHSHWRFEAEFCTPAEPHEKGGIEGEAGYFRRNHWVPVREVEDVAA